MKLFYKHTIIILLALMTFLPKWVVAQSLWSGTVTLDDGTVLEIKELYAFCEYVENRW